MKMCEESFCQNKAVLNKARSVFEIKDVNSSGEFSGYASVFNVVDHQGDIVEKGAFSRCLAKAKFADNYPKLLWQHDQTKPIGFIKNIYEDEKGLFIQAQLLLDLKQAREAYALLKNRVIEGMSIGYTIVKSSKKFGKNAFRRLLQVDLLEISLVTFAANPMAVITNVKSAESGVSSDVWLAADIHRLAAELRWLAIDKENKTR